jgi:hypothetical protein
MERKTFYLFDIAFIIYSKNGHFVGGKMVRSNMLKNHKYKQWLR